MNIFKRFWNALGEPTGILRPPIRGNYKEFPSTPKPDVKPINQNRNKPIPPPGRTIIEHKYPTPRFSIHVNNEEELYKLREYAIECGMKEL